MAINVAADLATLLGTTGEFSDSFTLWPDTQDEVTVRGILHLSTVAESRGQLYQSDEQLKAIFPTAAVVGLRTDDRLQGPVAMGSTTQALYRVLDIQPTPYATTEVWLKETSA
jgi:phosphohistidine phosphatase SixA